MLANQEKSKCHSIQTIGNIVCKHTCEANILVSAQPSSAFSCTVTETGVNCNGAEATEGFLPLQNGMLLK